jgi:hypothetical protein
MKTEPVRIDVEQAKILRDVASQMRGCTTNALDRHVSINGLVRDALALYIDVEVPVILAAFKEVRKNRAGRQAVSKAS